MNNLLRYKWIALLLAVSMLAGFLLLTNLSQEDRFQRLLEQERYEDLAEDLRRTTARNPERHDLRLLLAEVELLLDNPTVALGEMIAAALGDTTDADLEGQLLSFLSRTPESARECLSLLAQEAVDDPLWLWPRELAVRISLAVGSHEYTMETLPQLLSLDASHPLAGEAWRVMSLQDLAASWELAQLLGDRYKADMVHWVHDTDTRQSREIRIRNFYTLDSSYPGAMMLCGAVIGGPEGRALLDQSAQGLVPSLLSLWNELVLALALAEGDAEYLAERLGPKELAVQVARRRERPPWPTSHLEPFDRADAELIFEVLTLWRQQGQDLAAVPGLSPTLYYLFEIVGTDGLAFDMHHCMEPEYIWQLALLWFYDQDCNHEVKTLLNTLTALPQWQARAENLKHVLNTPPPKPDSVLTMTRPKTLSAYSWVSVSPDANIILYQSDTEDGSSAVWLFDIHRDTHSLIVEDITVSSVAWRQDSRYFALVVGSKVLIYSRQGEIVGVLKLDVAREYIAGFEYVMELHWQGEDLVFGFQTAPGAAYQVQTYDPGTRTLSESVEVPGLPMLTATGKLVYVAKDEDGLVIGNGADHRLDDRGQIRGWTAGDREVLVSSWDEYWIYRFSDAQFYTLDTDCISHAFTAGGKVYGYAGSENYLLHLDLDTWQWEPTGLRGGWMRDYNNMYLSIQENKILFYCLDGY